MDIVVKERPTGSNATESSDGKVTIQLGKLEVTQDLEMWSLTTAEESEQEWVEKRMGDMKADTGQETLSMHFAEQGKGEVEQR